MGDEEHNFKPLKIEKDGKRVQACQECGALKIGENTIVVDEDYIDLAPLTSNPTLSEGRMWLRGDADRIYWSPDGTNVEMFETGFLYDLNEIKGFVYLAEGTPTDSWYFTANPDTDVWIRQYSTGACFNAQYQFYGTYAHWTADNTFVDVPNKASNVYGAGEEMSVSQVADGTEIADLRFHTITGRYLGPQDMAWDGEYFWTPHGNRPFIYKWRKDGTKIGYILGPQTNQSALTFDGNYLWVTDGRYDWIYQITRATGDVVTSFPTGDSPQGVAWDGEYLWVAHQAISSMYKYTPGGTLKDSWGLYSHAEGVGWDGKYLYHCNIGAAGAGTGGQIYRLKRNGTEVDRFPVKGPTPESSTWDGKYVWESEEDSGWVYCYTGSGLFDLNYNISPA